MRWTAFLIAIFFCVDLQAQRYTLKNYFKEKISSKSFYVSNSLLFASGAAYGVHETLNYHYSDFNKTFPNNNPQFWNPEISWKNKWKNGNKKEGEQFLGSSTIFVFTTDGKHLFSALHKNLLTSGTTVAASSMFDKPYKKSKVRLKRPLWTYLMDGAINSISYSVGFHLTYTIIF